MPAASKSRILVIKLGALGDVVQALGAFQAIRRHHAGADVTLLTTGPFVAFAEASGLFERVWPGGRPGAADIAGWLALRRRLREGGFERVYDLQTSARSSFYFRLFWPGPKPEWSGTAGDCSHPHANPDRDSMHTIERLAEQLAMAGISEMPAPDLGWAGADIGGLGLSGRYALLAPGGARHRPDKRWPVENYGALAKALADTGVRPVLLGTADEAGITGEIAARAPAALDLAGRTDLMQVAALGRGAELAVGNDTGPMHLLAAVGCPVTVLYSHASDPALCAQRGPRVNILRRQTLDGLSVADVLAELPS